MNHLQNATQQLIDRMPGAFRLPGLFNRGQAVEHPQLESYSGCIALVGADLLHSTDRLAQMHAAQTAHTLERVGSGSGVIAVQALVPETVAEPGLSGVAHDAEAIAEALNKDGSNVVLVDRSAQLPVGENGATSGLEVVDASLQKFRPSQLYVGVVHPEVAGTAFPGVHVAEGGVVTLESIRDEALWIPR